MDTPEYQYIKDDPDYRHLSDRELYKKLYEEVGTVEANQNVVWREEWMKYFHPDPDAKILELGSHNGPNLIHYARLGNEIHGVELSETLIATCQRYLQRETQEVQQRVKIFPGWIEDFKPSIRYDYVLCTEILEHVADPVKVLQVARAALKENGCVYISSPSTLWGNNTHVRAVPEKELLKWLNAAGLTSIHCWTEDNRTFCKAISDPKLKIIGLTRIRNEAQIIQDTLDHLSSFCTGGIVVYDDASTDNTVEICKRHPAVLEVIQGGKWDSNRELAEYQNRAALLSAGKKYAAPDDWFVYLDADERIDYDWERIYKFSPGVIAVRMKLFDFYITEEDKDSPYYERKWLGPEYRSIIMAFRNLAGLSYHHPDQREVTLNAEGEILEEGYVKHYGKAISIQQWEQTCDYYSHYFPKYAAKWAARKGKAVHDKSDCGNPLIRWEERTSKGFPLMDEMMAGSDQPTDVQENEEFNQPSKRILIGINKLNDFTGSETYTVTLGKWLQQQGYEIHIYAHYGYGGEIFDNTSFIGWDKETISYNDFHYDVIITQQKVSTEVLSQKYLFVPLIAIHHGVIDDEKPLETCFYDYAVCVSQEVRQHIKDVLGETAVKVIPNMVDLTQYPYHSRQKPNRKILWAGGIHPWRIKSLEFAIELAGRIPDVQLDIIGQNQMDWREPEAENIHYLGTFKITPDILKNYSLVIGVGRIALEAAAVGTPVLIAGKDGVDGFLSADNFEMLRQANFSGRVAPEIYDEGVSEHYTARVQTLLEDSEQWLSLHKSYRKLRERFSVDVVAPELLEIIKTIRKNKKYLNILAITYKRGAVSQVRIISPYKELYKKRKIRYRLITLDKAKEITHHDLWDVDILVFQRIDFAPLLKVLRFAKRNGVKTVYEIDDNLLELPPDNPGYVHYNRDEVRNTIIQFVKEVDFMTVSTEPLKEYFSRYNSNIIVLPNQIDREIFCHTSKNTGDRIRIGFAGTVTHQGDFLQAIPALKRLQKEYKNRIQLVFINFMPLEFRDNPDVEFIPGIDYLPKFAKILAGANLDIGLAPLKFNEFNRGKSDVKFLEYGIQKIAGIYSDYVPYSNTVSDGITGLLVESENPNLWYEKIKYLIDNPAEIVKIKENAYEHVLTKRSFDTQAIRWFDAYRARAGVEPNRIQHKPRPKATANLQRPSGFVSIIILTWNALEYTKRCLESILKYTRRSSYELIIIDNGSSDGSVEYLRSMAAQYAQIRLIENAANRGFAAGNNQGAAAARGRYLLFLNNDVLVSNGWLEELVKGLEADERIGAVGPMTNRISGRQSYTRIPYRENDVKGFHKFAGYVRQVKANAITPRRRLAGFALLMTKKLFEELGGFDESYGTGNFEDDDLCLRIREKGYLLMVNEGVYIHHFGSRTFIANQMDYQASIQERMQLFHQKWPQVNYKKLIELNNSLIQELEGKKRKARKFIKDNKLSSAIEELRFVVQENPLDRAAVMQLAELYYKSQRPDLALTTLKKLLKCQPPISEALNLAGIITFEAGDVNKAGIFFERALQLNQDDVEYRKNLAETLIAKGDVVAGIKQYKRVLELNPKELETLIRLGQLYLESKAIDQAQEYFERALKIDPKNSQVIEIIRVIREYNSGKFTVASAGEPTSGYHEQILQANLQNRSAQDLLEQFQE